MDKDVLAAVGIGVDIVELERVENIRFLRRFAEFFLTSEEMEKFDSHADQVRFIASRFAVKEATIKAFPGFLSPHDFEIIKKGHKPAVHFFSTTNEEVYRAMVSISHSTLYAAGYAVILKK